MERVMIDGYLGYNTEMILHMPDSAPRGILCILHGMCEYKERYLPFMDFMAEAGYGCAIYDHRGHGLHIKEKQLLGYMDGAGAEGLIQDAHRAVTYIKNRFEGVPVILLGHSMGSLIARAYCRKYDDQISALILIGPPAKKTGVKGGLFLAEIIGKIKGWHYKSRLLQLLSLGDYAKEYLREDGSCGWICSDKQVIREYEASPFCGFTFTVDGYKALFQLMGQTYETQGWYCNHPKLPILFLAGEDDPCAGSKKAFRRTIAHMRRSGYTQISSRRYRGMRHEILNETERKQVFRDIQRWLGKQI